MRPEEETLTPKQRRFFASVLVLSTLAFGSVFVYAYIKGAQVQKAEGNISLSEGLHGYQSKSPPMGKDGGRVVCIPRGSTRWNQPGTPYAGRVWNRYWTFSRVPHLRGMGPKPMPQICAYAPQQGEWGVSTYYAVMVPPDADLGVYVAHFQGKEGKGDFRFEVILKESSSDSKASSRASKTDRPLVIMPSDFS